MSKTLEASIDIAATPEQVWSVVSDLKRMGEWSPQCKKMKVFGGEVRKGTTTVNVNRKGLLVWPTTAKVIEFDPGKTIAFRIVENKTIWSYTLTPSASGTTVTEKRQAPTGTSAISGFLVDKVLGGTEQFDVELVDGMNLTLQRIKRASELA